MILVNFDSTQHIYENYINRKWTYMHVINQPQYVTFTKVNKQQTKKIVSIILE